MGTNRIFKNPFQERLRARLPGSSRLVWQAPAGQVALTFDDGPDRSTTGSVLEALQGAGVRATFFMLTSKVRRDPELVEEVLRGGHSVQLHGDVHERIDRIPVASLAARLQRARDELEDVVQRPISLFRPPWGRVSARVMWACGKVGLDVAHWSHDPRDWEGGTVDAVAQRISDCLQPRAVVLLHDASDASKDQGSVTAAALTQALPVLSSRGLETTTIG